MAIILFILGYMLDGREKLGIILEHFRGVEFYLLVVVVQVGSRMDMYPAALERGHSSVSRQISCFIEFYLVFLFSLTLSMFILSLVWRNQMGNLIRTTLRNDGKFALHRDLCKLANIGCKYLMLEMVHIISHQCHWEVTTENREYLVDSSISIHSWKVVAEW